MTVTNFDFLLADKQFSSFADVAVAAEKLLHVDVDSCVLSCRRAMEFAVKWMYSVDADLHLPYDDTLAVLMSTEDFRAIATDDVLRRMTFVRKLGNNAAHTGRKITEQNRAELNSFQTDNLMADRLDHFPDLTVSAFVNRDQQIC